jgi:hypothetical protein
VGFASTEAQDRRGNARFVTSKRVSEKPCFAASLRKCLADGPESGIVPSDRQIGTGKSLLDSIARSYFLMPLLRIMVSNIKFF